MGEPPLVEVEEVEELLEGTLPGEEELLEAEEVGEAVWTEMGEEEAGVSTLFFHLCPQQNGCVVIDFDVELASLSGKSNRRYYNIVYYSIL